MKQGERLRKDLEENGQEMDRKLRYFISQIGSREKLEAYYKKSIVENGFIVEHMVPIEEDVNFQSTVFSLKKNKRLNIRMVFLRSSFQTFSRKLKLLKV